MIRTDFYIHRKITPGWQENKPPYFVVARINTIIWSRKLSPFSSSTSTTNTQRNHPHSFSSVTTPESTETGHHNPISRKKKKKKEEISFYQQACKQQAEYSELWLDLGCGRFGSAAFIHITQLNATAPRAISSINTWTKPRTAAATQQKELPSLVLFPVPVCHNNYLPLPLIRSPAPSVRAVCAAAASTSFARRVDGPLFRKWNNGPK